VRLREVRDETRRDVARRVVPFRPRVDVELLLRDVLLLEVLRLLVEVLRLEELLFLPGLRFLPAPPVSLFTVAHALRPASRRPTPRFSYPSSMCSAMRFCLEV
jgi:hypothetical protein